MTAAGSKAPSKPAEPARSEAKPSEGRPTRQEVWKILGAPTDQVGSVNDPRTHETHGVKWNEQWVYRVEGGQEIERVVLWHRYDFLGVFRVLHDGSLEAEPLATK